ncbi:geranylgeranylglycerol-phosphate geranylgeranyltransferase [Methanolinea mesophila]|uniref:geranylgeranylglycerol-phosphate geranylgeranyltransferase n=1 Tax=Methanolinea mesophila TaxID=547055 RepID=UPI001AEA0829|nr:geranylgeranylglycerol-phosphate geranylgeranyltransferase [Methanolinea mesophila]MBP1927488.1 geranylgeranylglycerol-phosphate geranylgeranyltransferase [Methanolinea mesophila]
MQVSGYIRIIRPANSVVAGIAAVIGYIIATGTLVPEAFLLFLVVLLVTGAGNTINDWSDVEIDRVNRPERPIPSGAVSRNGALYFAGALFLAGVAVSFFTTPLCAAIAVINSFVLVVYAVKLKKTPFLGNLAVSYLAGSIFLFGGALAGTTGLVHAAPVFLITLLAMVTRELLKDAEDVEGDSLQGASTVPIRYGVRVTVLLAFAFILCAVAASALPVSWWGPLYLAGIVPVDLFIVYSVLRSVSCRDSGCVKKSRSASLLKYGMFASLVVFLVAALLL